MRFVGLSLTPASVLRRQFNGLRSTHIARLHSSAQTRNMKAPREIPAEWLRRLIADTTSPPRLYAWTPENLSPESGTGSDPGSSPRTRPGTHSRDGSSERRRIYILGVGNIGRLYAMCLSKIADRPPITLVVHRRELLEHWAATPGIELARHGQPHRSADFDIEWWTDAAPGAGRAAEVAGGRTIGNLIVATKASDALPQVDRLRRYLGVESTVAFAQNGMCKLWPPAGDAYVRARFPGGASPSWIACVTTHGVTSSGPFRSIHAAPANALVGPVMGCGVDGGGAEHSEYLMRQIADAPDLDARRVSRKELWVAQLEKLVVNAVINPLTAVLRCKNGEIFVRRDDALPAVISRLVSEAAETLSNLILDSSSDEILNSASISQGATSEHSADESLEVSRKELLERFSTPRLLKMVYDVGAKVGANTSSMLQDVRAGKPTEIDDFNGWLVDTARLVDDELRLSGHENLIALVKSQASLTRAELCASLL